MPMRCYVRCSILILWTKLRRIQILAIRKYWLWLWLRKGFWLNILKAAIVVEACVLLHVSSSNKIPSRFRVC